MILTKISFTNKEFFAKNKDNNLKSKRVSKIGPIFLAIALSTTMFTAKHSMDNQPKIDIPTISTITEIEYDSSDINELNIIINDDDCSDTFFREVCNKLEDEGIEFKTSKDSYDVNKDNSTVITLDQQYSAGESTLIFAPYDNTRLGNSDSLALAMKAEFSKNGFKVNGLSCSQIGYVQDENGNVCCDVPTDTEKEIDINNDTSFVTISFGTHYLDTDAVVKSIINGLARQKYYLDNNDTKMDLVYRSNGDEDIGDVANYFGTSTNELRQYNSISDKTLADSQAIINPQVKDIASFKRDVNIEVKKGKVNIF